MNRIALAYPKIPGSSEAPFRKCIAFEKYDGTNLHWVWDPELEWHAFGTRRDRFDLDDEGINAFNAAHAGLEEAADLFIGRLASSLTNVFRAKPALMGSEVIAFTEFLGNESFAGKHKIGNAKRLVLIDIAIDGRILPPEQFVALFADLPIARVVYEGKLNGRFVNDVRTGKYDVAEGVICKGESDGEVWMAKIKTDAYMDKLKEAFQLDWESYWE